MVDLFALEIDGQAPGTVSALIRAIMSPDQVVIGDPGHG